MFENRLIITSRKNKEKILKETSKKIIELDGDKINEWKDFYDVIQEKLDYWNYDEQFGKFHEANTYTYADIVGDYIVYEKLKEEKKEGILIALDYTKNFKSILDDEREWIFTSIFYHFLLEWYRDLRIMFKQNHGDVSIEVLWYIFIDSNESNFQNEIIISTESDIKNLDTKLRGNNFFEIEFNDELDERIIKRIKEEFLGKEDKIFAEEEKEIREIFLNELNSKIKDRNKGTLSIYIKNFDNLWFAYRDNILSI